MTLKSSFAFFLIFIFVKSYGQIDTSNFKSAAHSFGIVSSYSQIKEGFNLGLVFGGPQFDMVYLFTKDYGKHKLIYESEIGGAILKSKKMSGYNIHFKAADFSLLYLTKQFKKSQLHIGGNFLLNYNYQLYPDLQSGQSYWLSQMQLSPKFTYSFQLPKNRIEVQFTNSVFGFISRPQTYIDPYFFKINFGEFTSNANSQFKAGSFNMFNATNFKLNYLVDKPKTKFVIGYEFNYIAYYQSPIFEMITHSLLLQIQFKKK